MILLDTDHVSVLQIREGQRTQQLKDRLAAAGDPVVGTTIISAAVTQFERLPGKCRRIGMMDRKIASICLATNQ
jgi:hypothetical protein